MKRIWGNKCKNMLAILLACALAITTVLQFDLAQVKADSLTITESAGWFESAYAEWLPVNGATGYKAYVKKASEESWTQLDNELIRQYDGYWRADALGLAAGSYLIKVEAVLANGSNLSNVTPELNVNAYERSGFAFSEASPLGSASGAYNDDGTLKSGAQVVYVTPDTAKTCEATVNGTKVTGFQAILDAKQKKNTSNDIIDFRIVGCVRKADLDGISSSAEGIQVKGAAAYTNMNITIEGVGEDAAVHGFGFLIRNCGNVEFRNFGVLDFMDDGVSIDTNNCNLWIHNLDFFYGQAGGDSDQKKGDGSLDIKKSQYCTVSYNHFWDSGKCCLVDASAATSGYADNLTYHHNWFDHSDSRHPRIRNGKNFHIYNNYYDGNSKYGVGVTTGSSAFVEANWFENCNYPMLSSLQGSDVIADGIFSGETGGIIKAYANHIEGAASYIPYSDSATTEFDAYEVSSKSETVPENVTTKAGTSYSNFDTDSSMYSYAADSAEAAKANVMSYAGRMNGGDLKWTFDASENANYSVIPELKAKVVNYTSPVVSIGGTVSTGSAGEVSSATTQETKPSTGESTGSTAATAGSTAASGSSSGNYVHNFTTDGKDSTFFSITGSLSTSKGTASYNGMTLTQCLKMESSTNISFTTTSDAKLVLVFNTASKKVKVDGSDVTASSEGIVEKDIKAGSHTVTKKDSINLFYMAVISDEADTPTQASSQAATQASSQAATQASSQAATQASSQAATQASSQAATQASSQAATEASTQAPTQAPSTEKKDFSLNVSDLSKTTYTQNFEKNGFTILADSTNTVVVDGSSKTFNNVSYANRLKTGGEGTASYRSIKFTTADAATITIVAVSSNSKDSRVLGISDGTTDAEGKLVDIATANVGTSVGSVKLTVPEAGTYYLHSTSGGINFYNIDVKYAVSGGSTSDRPDDEVREKAPGYKTGDLYVSTKGKADAKGSFDDPMDFVTAVNSISAGNTIWMFSGTYYAYDMYQEPIIIAESNSGKENAYKKISSINGKTVTIDFDGMAEEGSNRGITLDGSYWHFYDIDICNAGDNGMLLSGDHNIIELCQFYGNHDTGLQLSRYNTNYATIDLWPSYNTILNCTAFNNKDEATAENADGFAAKLTCGEGNVFDGCMSYCNSDDGWDLYAKPATGPIGVVTIKNCVAFGNGKLTDGTGSANGDMNGFKLGGSNGACPTPHVVENCVAFYNGATGFTDNGNGGAVKMSNCTAFGNGVYDSNKANYMCYRTSADAVYKDLLSYVSSSGASTDQFLGKLEHVLYNYKSSGYYWVNSWVCTDGAKTKYSGSEAKDYTVSASDFVSTNVPGYNSSTGAYTSDYHKIFRNDDGSVNLNGLFEVKESSRLYKAGVNGGYLGASFAAKSAETPTETPTEAPTQKPTEAPTQAPTEAPTQAPTEAPTQAPTEAPTSTEAAEETPTYVTDVDGKSYKAEVSTLKEDAITDEAKAAIGCSTVEEVALYLKEEVAKDKEASKILEGVAKEETLVIDITIKVSPDGGRTWVKATRDNFPANGIDVVIPYPKNVNPSEKDFVVGHLITVGYNGIAPGTMEYYKPVKTENGLKIHIMSASPFIVAWKTAEVPQQIVESNDDDDDSSENIVLVAKAEAQQIQVSEAVKEVKSEAATQAQAKESNESAATADAMADKIPLLAMILIMSGAAALISCKGKKRVM